VPNDHDRAPLWPAFDIWEVAQQLRAGAVSSLEIVEVHLARIARLDGTLKACVTVMKDEALAAAGRADLALRGGRAGTSPLLGVPIAVKDNFETAGVRTTAGSPSLSDYIPSTDAVSVQRLRAAGAVVVAKVNLDEFALGGTSANPIGGATLNPWDARSVPGGSSGGSGAAVAAGMCMAATGSDTGGSIRNPSAWCGVTGLKPTYNAIDPGGVIPLAWSLDTVGFLTRTNADCAVLFAETADEWTGRPHSEKLAFIERVRRAELTRRPRLLLADNVVDLSELAIQTPFRAAVERLRDVADIETVELPRLDDALLATVVILLSEGSAAWEAGLRSSWERYGKPVRALLDLGRLVRAAEYVHAQRMRESIRREIGRMFHGYDAILLPSMGIAPRPGVFDEDSTVLDSPMWHLEAKFTCMWNLTGAPVLSLPCAFTSDGRPFAMQIVVPPNDEERLLRLGSVIESALAIPRTALIPTWVRSVLGREAV
jgi:aspartyl-tRNA(Asn)/glutamyl-tRNA(Gln) amidotransferase subunit A